MEEPLEEDLEGWRIGAQATNVKLSKRRPENVPCCPSNVVRLVESVPAVVSAHGTQRNDTVTNGKDAKQCQLLPDRDPEVPVQERGQHGSEEVLCHGDDASGENVGAFVETVKLVPLRNLQNIELIPERGDGLASDNGGDNQGNAVSDNVSDTHPGRPVEGRRHHTRR